MKKKLLAMLLALAMVVSVAVGCGNNGADEPAEEPAATPTAAEDDGEEGDTPAEADSDLPFAGETLKLVVTDTQAEGAETQKLIDLVRERTGIELELIIIPLSKDGEMDKVLLRLQANDELDIVYGTTNKLKIYYNAGVLAPIDELAAADGYDFASVFRTDSLPTFDDGKTYGLPAFSDIWMTLINTKWFEAAGVDIPDPASWTWEEYIKTAQAINDAGLVTDNGEKVWGSFMETYNNYNYLLATQKGAEPYKADGTANFDDALYSEAMEWFNSLGNELAIQPDKTNMLAGTYAWNQFVASDDMAMFVCGGWVASMLSNTEQYPRDWQAVMLPMPYPAGESPSTLTIPGCYAIPSTSVKQDAAFAALKVIAEEIYTLGEGRIPARADLTDAEVDAYIQNLLDTTFANDPGTTVDHVKAAWFDSYRAFLPEKIIGTADTTINDIFKAEGDLYGTGNQDLATTMQKIQEQANKAIEDELNAG